MEGVRSAAQNSDDELMRAKISVWWDYENCNVPEGCDPNQISSNIHSALNRMNYLGPVKFFCYGDTTLIPDPVKTSLIMTAVSLIDTPPGRSVEHMLVDMLFWALRDNPGPANILLISGDGRLSRPIHLLGMSRYNILLAAQPENLSVNLLAATNTAWLWTSLVADGPPLSDEEYNYLFLRCCENEENEDGQVPV